jgi:hypothetical protein
MAVVLKPGARLRSTTCTTEVIVVRAPLDLDLRCGGEPMLDAKDDRARDAQPVPPFDQGTQIGKRYVDEAAGLELLCTKAGAGSLALAETPLEMKGAKPLPASD